MLDRSLRGAFEKRDVGVSRHTTWQWEQLPTKEILTSAASGLLRMTRPEFSLSLPGFAGEQKKCVAQSVRHTDIITAPGTQPSAHTVPKQLTV